MEHAFARAGKTLEGLSLRPALERFVAAGDDELFDMVGRGRVAPAAVLGEIFPGLKEDERAAAAARVRIEDGRGARLYVRGGGLGSNTALHFGDCCTPIPGDRIVGIVQPGGEGVTVHAIDCGRLAEFEEMEEVWRDLHWTAEAERSTVSRTRVLATVKNAPGMLGVACTLIGEAGGNIANLRMTHRRSDFFDVEFEIDVVDSKHLAHISAALRTRPEVETVERVRA